jgi:Zn-dependent protease with chaperone function
MEKIAASDSTKNLVMFSEEFLDKHKGDKLRFVAAHEISHARARDSYGATSMFRVLHKNAMKLAYGAAGVALLGAGFGAAPLIMAAGVPVLKGVMMLALGSVAAGIGLNYANRIKERRADRNAVYLTGKLDPAIDFLRETERRLIPPRRPAWLELSTHPSYYPRVANLKASFEKIRGYEPARSAAPSGSPRPTGPAMG